VVRERAYWYDFPTLEGCRKAWDKKYGGPFGWPQIEEDEGAPSQRELDRGEQEPY
jgi:hypothetical protein